jgi:hypothetical protein
MLPAFRIFVILHFDLGHVGKSTDTFSGDFFGELMPVVQSPSSYLNELKQTENASPTETSPLPNCIVTVLRNLLGLKYLL